MSDTRDAKAATQIFVILTIRYFAEIDLVAPTIVKQCAMLQKQLVSRYIEYVVVPQVVSRHDAFIAPGQIAKFRFELQAAIRQ